MKDAQLRSEFIFVYNSTENSGHTIMFILDKIKSFKPMKIT